LQYTKPVSNLINLGETRELIITTDWPDYKSFGLSEKDIPQLIETLTDWNLFYSDQEASEKFAGFTNY
jgi:hypothetical protein